MSPDIGILDLGSWKNTFKIACRSHAFATSVFAFVFENHIKIAHNIKVKVLGNLSNLYFYPILNLQFLL